MTEKELKWNAYIMYANWIETGDVTVTNIPEADLPKAVDLLKLAHADQTKNNWEKVLAFDGTTYPEKPEFKDYGDDD